MSQSDTSTDDEYEPPLIHDLHVDIGPDEINQLEQTGELTIEWDDVGPAPEGWSEVRAETHLNYEGDDES